MQQRGLTVACLAAIAVLSVVATGLGSPAPQASRARIRFSSASRPGAPSLHPAADPQGTCHAKVDNPNDPLHGMVRAGDDYTCMGPVDNHTLETCMAACCGDSRCQSFSFDAPWTLNVTYLGCVKGENCCCLKGSVAPLGPNSWNMNITTGVVERPPPPLCAAPGVCCSLNGDVVDGACKCDAGWTGRLCGTLDLRPVASLDGAFETKIDPSTCNVSCGPSSWGGLPLKDADGKYHMFAAQFINNCSLGGWNPGSMVVRAVADNPMGPFKYAETIFGTFHHNPTVRRLSPEQSGTGKELFVMLMIGDDTAAPEGKGAECPGPGALDPHHLEGYIKMAWSDSLLGPWNRSHHQVVSSGSINDWDAMVTNPAPFFMEDGTAYIFYRGTRWPTDGYERIGFAKAATWRGPYGRPFGSHDPLWNASDSKAFVEDPFVWNTTRGYHMLNHGHWDENGYLAFAQHIEGPWYFHYTPAYTNVVAMTDGTNSTFVQRERPQLLFDRDTGRPEILYTGVIAPWGGRYGFSYTFAQRVK